MVFGIIGSLDSLPLNSCQPPRWFLPTEIANWSVQVIFSFRARGSHSFCVLYFKRLNETPVRELILDMDSLVIKTVKLGWGYLNLEMGCTRRNHV